MEVFGCTSYLTVAADFTVVRNKQRWVSPRLDIFRRDSQSLIVADRDQLASYGCYQVYNICRVNDADALVKIYTRVSPRRVYVEAMILSAPFFDFSTIRSDLRMQVYRPIKNMADAFGTTSSIATTIGCDCVVRSGPICDTADRTWVMMRGSTSRG